MVPSRKIDGDDPVDELEILESHETRGSCRLGSDELVDARAQILQHEILFPLWRGLSFTSVSTARGHLDAKGLVDRKGDVEKIKAVDAEVVDGVTLRVILSRGMSQVSEMILATVSNVADIYKSMICKAFCVVPSLRLAAAHPRCIGEPL
jgi:hypothetical protein